MPSLNQISAGLIAEAMFQLTLAMGNVKEQKLVLKAQANIKKTWEDLLADAQVQDRNAPLGEISYHKSGETYYEGILHDPNSPVVAINLYIYQMENFAYSELNRSSRFKDSKKVPTLGPWGAALFIIIMDT